MRTGWFTARDTSAGTRAACTWPFTGDQTDMTAITLDADIKARWPQGHCSHSPGNPEELMIIAVDLLIKELGTEGARAFITQVWSRYATTELPA